MSRRGKRRGGNKTMKKEVKKEKVIAVATVDLHEDLFDSVEMKKWDVQRSKEIQIEGRRYHDGFMWEDVFTVCGGLSVQEKLFGRMMGSDSGEVSLGEVYGFEISDRGCTVLCPWVYGSAPPEIRLHHLFKLVGKYGYLIGGYKLGSDMNSNLGCVSTVYRLDMHTYTWERVLCQGEYPKNWTCASGVGIGEKLYVFGGVINNRGGGLWDRSNELYCLDTIENRWEKIQVNGTKPPGSCNHSVVSIFDRYLLVQSGNLSRSKSSSDTWMFDTESKTWTNLPTRKKPVGVELRSCDIMFDKRGVPAFLIYYGGSTISGQVLNTLHALDLRTLVWHDVPTSSKKMVSLMYNSVICKHGVVTIYGGSHKDLSINEKIYNFTMYEEVLEMQISFTWICNYCKQYTQRKCSICNLYSFCSLECEKLGASTHQECFGYDDPFKLEFENLKEEKEQLSLAFRSIEIQFQESQNMIRKYQRLYEQSQERSSEYENQILTLVEEIESVKHDLDLIEVEKRDILKSHDTDTEEWKNKIHQLGTAKDDLHNKLEMKNTYLNKIKKKMKRYHSASEDKVKTLTAERDEIEGKMRVVVDEYERKMEDLEDYIMCSICMDSRVECRFDTCGHVSCFSCAESIFPNCHYCRREFTTPQKLYLN